MLLPGIPTRMIPDLVYGLQFNDIVPALLVATLLTAAYVIMVMKD